MTWILIAYFAAVLCLAIILKAIGKPSKLPIWLFLIGFIAGVVLMIFNIINFNRLW